MFEERLRMKSNGSKNRDGERKTTEFAQKPRLKTRKTDPADSITQRTEEATNEQTTLPWTPLSLLRNVWNEINQS
jgi:hypothetical protein